MQFTYRNHLKYRVGDRLFGHRLHSDEPYRVTVGRADPDRLARSSWLDEQIRTANLVADDLGRDSMAIMFSGGTDSEIVVRIFHRLGIKARIIFIRFADGANDKDFLAADRLCKTLNVPLEIMDFDVRDFYHSGAAAELAQDIDCCQMAYLAVFHHVRQISMPTIMGGEILLRRQVYTDRHSEWYYVFDEVEDASAMRFSLRYGIPLVNEWFSYTPEAMAYFLQHPTIRSLVSTRFNYKLASGSTKNQVLKEFMPEIFDKTKSHGYENLLGFNQQARDHLQTLITPRLENSLDGILLSDLEKSLYGNY